MSSDMPSLGDGLVHLSLEIDDKTKSIELLQQLIEDSTIRHAQELASYQNEQSKFLDKFTTESKRAQEKISDTTKSLNERKNTLDAQLNDLLLKKKEVETTKKENLDAIRREIAETKEAAHQAYKQERSLREKAWLERRTEEIQKLTWKGIQPNIERLQRKHIEQCEEIEAKTQFAKQKLELQCDNELADRIHTFQQEQEQKNTSLAKQTEIANLRKKEEEQHKRNLAELKQQLAQEEETTKQLHALELETLAKDLSVKLSKLKISKINHLSQQLQQEKISKKVQLESKLDQLEKDMIVSKTKWEEDWQKGSALRVEEQTKQIHADLLQWRKQELDKLIRQSVLDDQNTTCIDTSDSTIAELKASHRTNVAQLNESIDKQNSTNEGIKKKLASLAKRKSKLEKSLDEVEEMGHAVEDKLSDITNKYNRTKNRQEMRIKELHNGIDKSIQSISRKQNDVEQEIVSFKENSEKELQ